ncbi:MAG: carbon-nitrogen hydrolase family protein [Pirellulales bacterium]
MNLQYVLLLAVFSAISVPAFSPISDTVRADDDNAPPGWSTQSPRDELRPQFWSNSRTSADRVVMRIEADERTGLVGAWTRTQTVKGGQYYSFTVERKTTGMSLTRRSAVPEITWLDEAGRQVLRAEPSQASFRAGQRPTAEPEFPKVVGERDGWTVIEGIYEVPPDATQARIDLHFRWGEPHSRVEWSNVSLREIEKPKERVVRVAAVHLQPTAGKTAQDKCEQFAPLIAHAAQEHVDLVVLPETLTYYGRGVSYADAAEPVPGPSTNYFGTLAEQHKLHIVAGLIEREGHLIYNVAVLIGPDGKIIGKYRKVTLPRGEIEGGITPGDDCPVFETRIGKIGMMVCYDGFFPEVARELSNRGAEIIAWPVWGCNPMLAEARACENHVTIISSTYCDRSMNWMLTAVYGHDGRTLAVADQWGSLAIAELRLDRPLYWSSLGDFQSQIQPHRPFFKTTP